MSRKKFWQFCWFHAGEREQARSRATDGARAACLARYGHAASPQRYGLLERLRPSCDPATIRPSMPTRNGSAPRGSAPMSGRPSSPSRHGSGSSSGSGTVPTENRISGAGGGAGLRGMDSARGGQSKIAALRLGYFAARCQSRGDAVYGADTQLPRRRPSPVRTGTGTASSASTAPRWGITMRSLPLTTDSPDDILPEPDVLRLTANGDSVWSNRSARQER